MRTIQRASFAIVPIIATLKISAACSLGMALDRRYNPLGTNATYIRIKYERLTFNAR